MMANKTNLPVDSVKYLTFGERLIGEPISGLTGDDSLPGLAAIHHQPLDCQAFIRTILFSFALAWPCAQQTSFRGAAHVLQ